MFSAVSLRTPLTGMRCSRAASKPRPRAGGRRPARPAAAGAARRLLYVVAGDRAQRPGAGRARRRSTPRSRASLRTGGLASTGPPPRPSRGDRRAVAGAGDGAGCRPPRPVIDRGAAGRRRPGPAAYRLAGAALGGCRSSGRNRPGRRSGRPGPDRRSGRARPRPRPARSRPRPATPPTGSAAGRASPVDGSAGRRPGRCRSR